MLRRGGASRGARLGPAGTAACGAAAGRLRRRRAQAAARATRAGPAHLRWRHLPAVERAPACSTPALRRGRQDYNTGKDRRMHIRQSGSLLFSRARAKRPVRVVGCRACRSGRCGAGAPSVCRDSRHTGRATGAPLRPARWAPSRARRRRGGPRGKRSASHDVCVCKMLCKMFCKMLKKKL